MNRMPVCQPDSGEPSRIDRPSLGFPYLTSEVIRAGILARSDDKYQKEKELKWT